jgi:hypothetical protein
MVPLVCWIFLVSLLGVGCASSESPLLTHLDGAVIFLDGAPDLLPFFDVYTLPRDKGIVPGEDGRGCQKGTVESCGYCGNSCPPGEDTEATLRECDKGVCGIQCQGEYYDVDDSAEDGCETLDDLPLHDTQESAKDLGSLGDCDNAYSVSSVLPSDERQHVTDPKARPNGRADWFSVRLSDDYCVLDGRVKVSLLALPTSARYGASVFYICEDGTTLASDTRTGNGGSELFLAPNLSCTTLGDDSGTLYIKVSKESGEHSSKSYSLEITP